MSDNVSSMAGSAGAAAACVDFCGQPEPQRLPLAAPHPASVSDHDLAQPAGLTDRAPDCAGVSVVDVQRVTEGAATVQVGVGKPGPSQSSYAMGPVDRTTDEALRTARELRNSTLKTATDTADREAWSTLSPRVTVDRHGGRTGATVQASAAGKSVTIDAS